MPEGAAGLRQQTDLLSAFEIGHYGRCSSLEA